MFAGGAQRKTGLQSGRGLSLQPDVALQAFASPEPVGALTCFEPSDPGGAWAGFGSLPDKRMYLPTVSG